MKMQMAHLPRWLVEALGKDATGRGLTMGELMDWLKMLEEGAHAQSARGVEQAVPGQLSVRIIAVDKNEYDHRVIDKTCALIEARRGAGVAINIDLITDKNRAAQVLLEDDA